jgi:hypothetical protein
MALPSWWNISASNSRLSKPFVPYLLPCESAKEILFSHFGSA